MLAIARLHGVLGVVFDKLPSLEQTHPEVWEKAQRCWRGQVVHSRRTRHYATETVNHFNNAGIDVLIVKGTDFADALYPVPQLRPTFDIDLLVRPDDWQRATDVLASHGYAEKTGQRPICGPTGTFGEQTWVHPLRVDIEVDLHWNMVYSPTFQGHASVDLDKLDRQNGTHMGAFRAPLSASSRLLLAAMHAICQHQFDHWRLLMDLRQACRHFQQDSQMESFMTLLKRTGTTAHVAAALQIAEHLVTDEAISAVRAGMLRSSPACSNLTIPQVMLDDAKRSLWTVSPGRRTFYRQRLRQWIFALK